jgi:hypothetical protein
MATGVFYLPESGRDLAAPWLREQMRRHHYMSAYK